MIKFTTKTKKRRVKRCSQKMHRQTGHADPGALFEKEGIIGLSNGIEFGAPGFLHLNFACSRAKLGKSLEKMRLVTAHGPIAKD